MLQKLQQFFNWVNRQNLVPLLFLIAMVNFFGFRLEGGEEQYFAFAKQYMNPEWMPNSFTLNHPAGGNLPFQVIVGVLLRFLSFEAVAAIGRAVCFLLYAFPLALIFRKLKISNLEALFVLQVVFFGHQSLFAGEWIFKNFEEKTLAYIFVFWSLYYMIDEKPALSAAFASGATYFHFLVGGWMFCLVFLYFIVTRARLLKIVLAGVVYTVITIPLILYLYQTYIIGNPAVVHGINTNIIYAYWRLKHHIGIVNDWKFFIENVWWGVLIMLFIFYLCIRHLRKIPDVMIRNLNTFTILIISQQVLFLIIGIFDRNAVLMKTYPFRTNSLFVFVFLLEATLIVKYYMANRLYPFTVNHLMKSKSFRFKKALFTDTFNILLFIVIIPVSTYEFSETIRKNTGLQKDLDKPMLELIDYVRQNTPGSSVFLFVDSDRPLSFIRRAERERFVVVKFTPTRSEAIYEWHKRFQLKERIRKDIAVIDSVKKYYQIDYMVSDSLYNYPTLELEKVFGNHKLFKLRQAH